MPEYGSFNNARRREKAASQFSLAYEIQLKLSLKLQQQYDHNHQSSHKKKQSAYMLSIVLRLGGEMDVVKKKRDGNLEQWMENWDKIPFGPSPSKSSWEGSGGQGRPSEL